MKLTQCEEGVRLYLCQGGEFLHGGDADDIDSNHSYSSLADKDQYICVMFYSWEKGELSEEYRSDVMRQSWQGESLGDEWTTFLEVPSYFLCEEDFDSDEDYDSEDESLDELDLLMLL